MKKKKKINPHIGNDLLITLLTSLILFWIYILNDIQNSYLNGPTELNLVIYSILHYVIFILLILVIFIFSSKTYLEVKFNLFVYKLYRKLSIYIKKYWFVFFIYIVSSIILTKIESTNDKIIFTIIIIEFFISLVLILSIYLPSKSNYIFKIIDILIYSLSFAFLYLIFIQFCSILLTDININAQLDKDNQVLTIEIEEVGYFFTSKVTEVKLNNDIEININGGFPNKKYTFNNIKNEMLSEGRNFLYFKYRPGGLVFEFDRYVQVRETVFINIE